MNGGRDQRQSEFMQKVYKPLSTIAERGQDLSLTPRKHKFKPNLAEKKQQLSKSKKLLLEKSKDLENMKNQLEIRLASMDCWKKKMKKSIHKTKICVLR